VSRVDAYLVFLALNNVRNLENLPY
jgi:hypothetical protein